MRPHASTRLGELAALYGIQPTYADGLDNTQHATDEAVLATLRALGAPAGASLDDAIRARHTEIAAQSIEPVQVAWNGRLRDVTLRLPRSSGLLQHSTRWQLTIHLESGGRITQFFDRTSLQVAPALEAAGYVIAKLPCALELELGYHVLRVETAAARREVQFESLVISAPKHCYLPARRREKSWGAFLPLYALRTRDDWGTGDFASLRRLHEWVRGAGGSWTGTLPLLATFLEHPCEPSPYMPVSRQYWNELFIAPEVEPEYRAAEASRNENWSELRQGLHQSPLVDYRKAMRLKRKVLEKMADQLSRTSDARHGAFLEYLAAQPEVVSYARFRAVHERLGKPWTQWPARMRAGSLTAADGDVRRERYHQYVQWIANRQLAQVSTQPGGGLYLDFPLGVHPHGYDVWRNQKLFALGAAAGAPPDALFPEGQNWSFPPLHPQALRQDGYRYFRECLRHQMQYARMLRIDHVMGLNRLYWIPEGTATRDGVYVQYPAEEMYAVLCLESMRAGTIVVGENLGTVPEAVNKALKEHRALGMYILQFSIDGGPRKPLRRPPAAAVASLNTHDLPPFGGFVTGRDIADFAALEVINPAVAAKQRKDRKRTVAALARALRLRSASGRAGRLRLLSKCLRWMSESEAQVVMVNLEDTWLESQPQNIPGTGPGTANPQQPNWRRRSRYSLEQITASPRIRRLLRQTFRRRNAADRRSV